MGIFVAQVANLRHLGSLFCTTVADRATIHTLRRRI